MSAYENHRKLIQCYVNYQKNPTIVPPPSSDLDIIRKNHKFVRDEKADAGSSSWEVRMALKYYKRLCKEYAICDLSRYKTGAVGLRWRVEGEVMSGKGQFECGAKACTEKADLHSYEVNFSYIEEDVPKNELVKVRLCPACAEKLYYRKIKEIRRERKRTGTSEADNDLSVIQEIVQREGKDDKVCRKRKRSSKGATKAMEQRPNSAVKGREEAIDEIIDADAADVWSRPAGAGANEEDHMDSFLKDLFM